MSLILHAICPGAICRVQTLLLAVVTGTLFWRTDSGLQGGDVPTSLANANYFLGVMFFSCINL